MSNESDMPPLTPEEEQAMDEAAQAAANHDFELARQQFIDAMEESCIVAAIWTLAEVFSKHHNTDRTMAAGYISAYIGYGALTKAKKPTGANGKETQ